MRHPGLAHMLDTLDSRTLGRTDCFGQRFMRAGTYAYNVLPAGGHQVTDERPFTIEVQERGGEVRMEQHTIVLRYADGRFKPEPSEMSIQEGDLVLWNCPDRAVPYAVGGDRDFFASDRMMNECGYSHAFGSPGEYRWKDAYGSSLGGLVRVKDPGVQDRDELRRWQESLKNGVVVMIEESRVEPREVDIVTGQTVFFAVTKTSGVSITDERLLRQDTTSLDGDQREGRGTEQS
jgi:plastocyanin